MARGVPLSRTGRFGPVWLSFGASCLIRMRRAWIILAVLVLAAVAWVYLFSGTPPWGPRLALKDTAVTSIELHWSGTNRTISSSDQCAQVIQVMRRARRSSVATTPPLGTLTLHYADGTTNMFYLSPSGRFSGLQVVGGSGGYVISMGEMLGTLEDAGLLTRDRK
jgi:hypothetical protein